MGLPPRASVPPPPPVDLASVRQVLAAKDQELVSLLAERMRLIREVARVKAENALPSFDREREGAHLDDLLGRARDEGVPDDLVRDVFGNLFAASRREQRSFLHARREHYRIGIIGGTHGMGAFLARVFFAGGYPVETMGLGVGAPAADVAARNDLVIIAVPIASTVDVIREVGPHVRKGACLADVTSVKAAPLHAMLEHTREEVDVVGTHPMFGPHGGDFDRQKVVLCRGRGEAGFARMKRLFEAFGAETIEATPDEHDLQMALIQVLVHEKTMVLGSVLERLQADLETSLQFASPIYRTELAMIGRMFSQRGELYADILTANSEAGRLSQLFQQEAAFFAQAVSSGDKATVLSRFQEIATFMKSFSSWAKKQSDAILDDLVRHG